jgi:HlyD family secretion protein
MDVVREDLKKKKQRDRLIYGIAGVAVLVVLTVLIYRLEPAAPKVSSTAIWTDTVERGEMVRQVRGPGSLIPEEFRWVNVSVDGVVEQIILQPGVEVQPGSVILELTNPELQQRLEDARLAYSAAQAQLNDTRVQLESAILSQEAATAAVESDFREAEIDVKANEALGTEGLISDNELERSRIRKEQTERRLTIERQRLSKSRDSLTAQMESRRAAVDQARALLMLREQEARSLQVKAGISGVLQEVPVEVGERVSPGTPLARVAQPDRLKAELRIAETQAKDLSIGLPAQIDTRNGIVEGRVARIDPSVREGTVTVDVDLTGELPRGARPDLSVDGTIQLERLENVLHMRRPTFGQAGSTVELFKVQDDGETAVRVPVLLGRTSVDTVEVVEGLEEGDEVILSDTSQWDEADRLEID